MGVTFSKRDDALWVFVNVTVAVHSQEKLHVV